MRGILVLILIGVAIGASAIAFMINNPGYALIVLAGYRLEASPYALILVIAVGTALLFLSLRVVSQLLGVLPGLGQWWRYRRQRREHEQVRTALLELVEERYDAFDGSIPKLKKSGWLSETAALTAQRNSLRRKMTSADSADQLKKVWRKASQVFRSEVSLQVLFAQQLADKGEKREAEAALGVLAQRGWSPAATELMQALALEEPRRLLARLEALPSSTQHKKSIERAKQALTTSLSKQES